ncbi:MAG: hypothetical protein J5705_06005 [Bacteroidaceae bacterium]|nr:hypothetical protein [Bacteroidaceae bacterium]
MNASKEILIFENVFSITVMHLLKRLLIVLLFATLIPTGIRAQEKKKFEINVGISTPGLYALTDKDAATDGNERYDFYLDGPGLHYPEEKQLVYFDLESYRSTLYPSISVELSYKLAETGFFKRLSLAGMLGYHMVGFENFDPVTKQSKKETALRLDFLMGARLRIIDRSHFCMYSQALLGKDFRNDCEYWAIANEFLQDGHEERVDYQVTFLGFQVDLGKESRLGLVTELGYGYEYSLSQLFVFIPGIRAGVSYKF